jgi:hypothetical protein
VRKKEKMRTPKRWKIDSIIERLLHSKEISVRYKVLVYVLGKRKHSRSLLKIQERIRTSSRVRSLLSGTTREGKSRHPYSKWRGAHWVLSLLADIGYPYGDQTLIPLREQVYQWLFSSSHEKGIKTINGRVRRCASQEGNALYSLLTLGLADERTDELAERLLRWQWEDGGWNCDKRPEAKKSSFNESLIPLRALALYSKKTSKKKFRRGVKRAAEIFLTRRLFRRLSDGKVMNHDFIKLHYPCYWHYDFLFGLRVMVESGYINDERCTAALELLESKRLPNGGFPAERKYYRLTEKEVSGNSRVDWGGAGKTRMNEFVTADALIVLKSAGRLKKP